MKFWGTCSKFWLRPCCIICSCVYSSVTLNHFIHFFYFWVSRQFCFAYCSRTCIICIWGHSIKCLWCVIITCTKENLLTFSVNTSCRLLLNLCCVFSISVCKFSFFQPGTEDHCVSFVKAWDNKYQRQGCILVEVLKEFLSESRHFSFRAAITYR